MLAMCAKDLHFNLFKFLDRNVNIHRLLHVASYTSLEISYMNHTAVALMHQGLSTQLHTEYRYCDTARGLMALTSVAI